MKNDLSKSLSKIPARGITSFQHEETEKVIRKSKVNLQTLFNTIDDMLFILDANGRILKTNNAVKKYLGYTFNELKRMHVLDVHPPERRPEAAAIIEEIMGGNRTTCPIPLMAKDGMCIPVETKVSQGKWNGRDVLFGISRNIIESKGSEEKLRESEAKYRFLTERMSDIIWTADMDLRLTYESPSVKKVLGFSPEELMGQVVSEMITPESRAMAVDALSRVLKCEHEKGIDLERTIKIELECYHKDGSVVWLECVASVIRDNTGKMIGIHGVSRDISERKRSEEELKKHRYHLEELVKERTGELAKLNELLKKENEVRKTTEAVLRSREIELEKKQRHLEERNIVLRILLENRDEDKNDVERNIISNIKSSVFPYIEKLKTSGLKEDQIRYCSEVESQLKNIASSFVKELSSEYIGLSPHEIQVASLIREGKSSKEIAELLNMSLHTALSHRYKIRIKTGLTGKKINLRTYLQTLK